MARRDLNVLDAANLAADRVDFLIDRRPGRRLIDADQLRRSVHSVGWNITEGFGRGTPRDRARVLRIARGEAEEAIQHLHDNLRAARISEKEYWATRNLLAVVVKMLNALTSTK
jgi:four helix bundle protein